jgi:hypothetical protein
MLLIILERAGHECRLELGGVDISRFVSRVELDVDTTRPGTLVRLTLTEEVYVIGTPGHLELQKAPLCEPSSD